MDSKRAYLRALRRLEPRIGRVYAEAIQRAIARASIREVEAAVLAGDIAGILAGSGFTQGWVTTLVEELRAVYLEAAHRTATDIRVLFNVTNPRAQSQLILRSSQQVAHLSNTQRQAVQHVLGASFGRNPRSVALDIVGRVDRRTGKRVGGIVNLTQAQASWVTNARGELEALDGRYLQRKARNRRFDGMVERAIASGKPLTARQIDRITTAYSSRLLKLRGDAIARTETIRAMAEGRDAAIRQGMEEGLFTTVRKRWRTAMDGDVRDAHAVMEGQEVAMHEDFTDGRGNRLAYPCDPNAPPETSINCRCFVEYRPDFIADALRG